MDERIDMDRLNRGAGANRIAAGDIENACRGDNKQRTKPLSTTDCGVAHRLEKPLARIIGYCQQFVEQRVDICRHLGDCLIQRCGGGLGQFSVRVEWAGAGRRAIGAQHNLLDPGLGSVEPGLALRPQLMPLLVQCDRFIKRCFAAFKLADNLFQRLERFFKTGFWGCACHGHSFGAGQLAGQAFRFIEYIGRNDFATKSSWGKAAIL